MTAGVTRTDRDTAEGVRRAIAAYALALDDGRVEDLVALFTPDGVSDMPFVGVAEGHEALTATYRSVVSAEPARHVVVNTLVTADRGDEIEATSDLLFFKQVEGRWAVALVGRYTDVLTHGGSGWLFARRQLQFIGL
jgi:hypothetical protein